VTPDLSYPYENVINQALIPTRNISRRPMKYDDASWHHGGDFPAGQPQEHGGTHIALFLRWCFVKGWPLTPILAAATNL
jgi:hypothetical protein